MKMLSTVLFSRLKRLADGGLALALAVLLPVSAAQAIEVAVGFRDVGYGSFGGSQLQNIGSPKSLLAVPGVTGVEFVQDTASGRFEALTAGCDSQGNDVAVTLRLTVDPAQVLNSVGGKITIPVCVNWLDQPGGKIEGFGFMMAIGGSYVLENATPASTVTFTRTAATAGTNFFADLTVSGGSVTYPFDGTGGSSFIGSANFKPAALVSALNSYFAAVNVGTPGLSVTKTAVDADASIPAAKAGDSVSWTVLAENTGSANLTYTGFADALAETKTYQGLDTDSDGTIDSTAALTTASVLLPGQTWKWTVSHVLTQAEVNAGKVENVASVTVEDSTTSTSLTAYSGADAVASTATAAPAAGGGAIILLPATATIEGVKTAAISTDVAPTGLSAGDTVTYTVAATNTGNVTLTNVGVQSDTLKKADLTAATNTLGSFALATGTTTLAPGAVASFRATYVVAQADIDAGGLVNTATVAGTPPTGPAVTDVTDNGNDGDGNTADDSTVLAVTAAPAMAVKKVASVAALSAAPKVGEVIGYTITVKNTGNVTLADIVLADALTTNEDYASGDADLDGKLDLTETWTYSASYTLTQADIDAGKVENLAVASATPPSGIGGRFSVESSAATDGNATAGTGNGAATVTTLAASPAMAVKKVASVAALSAAPKVGEVIGYTITVKNTGNVTLADIVLADALTTNEDYASGDADSDGKLDLTETWTYSASYTLTQADIDAGKVENLAVASATPPAGIGGRFSVESSAATDGNATAGTGNGAATVTTLAASPAMAVKKVASVAALSAAPKVGEVIGYTITVKNTGNVTLADIVLADALTSDEDYASGDADSDGKLDLTETWTYSASYTLTQADIDAGKVENLAVASATPPSGIGGRFSVESSAATDGNATAGTDNGAATVTTLAASPAMAVKKVADASALSAAPKVGEVIGYTITVKNTGNVTLADIVLADALTSDEDYASGDADLDGKLDLTETWTYSASYTLTQADIDAGKVENLAVASATPPAGIGGRFSVESSAATDGNATAGEGNGAATVTTLAASPAMAVKKVASVAALSAAPKVGEVIGYTITVKNTGNVTLADIVLADALTTNEDYASGDADLDGKLDLTETWTYSASYTLTQADIDAGKVENLAVASATPPSGIGGRFSVESSAATDGNATAGTGNGAATVTTLAASAGISVKKTVDDSALDDGVRAGDELLYTIEVTNTGNVTLTDVDLVDTFTDALGNDLQLTSGPTPVVALVDDTLGVGQVWTLTARYTLDAAAIAAGGVENLATVTGTPPTGAAVTAESKVSGNGTADGEATSTGFPGEISGTVREYLKPQAGVTVYLLAETAPGVYDYVLKDGLPVSVVTGSDGTYSFLGLPPGSYGVEFGSDPAASLTAVSPTGEALANRIVNLAVGAGAVEVRQDAFFIDPAGVIYDAETFAPLAGAVVTLEHNGVPVPDAWLNLTLGNPNGSVTDASGLYTYILDPTVAPSGTYRLRVERAGYKASAVYPPAAGALVPALGGGIQKVVGDDTVSDGMTVLYYMAFDFIFDPSNIAATSNGVVNNHIPLDADLMLAVKSEVEAILRDDLAMTLRQQGRAMQGYAEGALKRLRSQDKDTCLAEVERVLKEEPLAFDGAGLTEASQDVLDRVAVELRACPDSRFELGVYADRAAPEAQALTDERAALVLAGLRARGVETWQVAARGYGFVAGKGGVVFALLEAAPEGGRCVDSTNSSHAISADAGETGSSLDARINRESRDCATQSWRILSGSLQHMTSQGGMDQTMLNLSLRRERLVGEDAVRGRFVGAYASQSTVAATASGEFLGFGVNAGVYGAQRVTQAIYFDYYLGLAAGRHGFDFAFDRVGGVVDAKGHYTYGAVFAGAALSGEAEVKGLTLTPRAGVDLAWSPGGSGELTATRGLLKDVSQITVPQIVGAHFFAEVRVEDLLPESGAELAFTPGLFCDRGFEAEGADCGVSARVELSRQDEATGRSVLVAVDLARSGEASSSGLTLAFGWPAGAGRVDGGASLASSGEVAVNGRYELKF